MHDTSFHDALREHLSALQARDVDRFAATLGDDVTVVDGRGVATTGRKRVLAAHAAWFRAPDDWRFDYAVRLTRGFGDAALALVAVAYRPQPDAVPARFLLSLLFARDGGGTWRFVYDQNTPLSADGDGSARAGEGT